MLRTTRLLASALFVTLLLFGSLPAMAQTYSVVARVGLNRPGCDGFYETVVELTNFDPNHWYKVRIEGMSRVADPEHYTCGAGIPCSTSLYRDEVVLAPASSQYGTCLIPPLQYQMPSHAVCPTCADNCDNRLSRCVRAPGDTLEVTCGETLDEWCMELMHFRATIISRSVDGNEPWKNEGIVIAAKGRYGSSPPVTEISYCTYHTPPVFTGCNPPPPPPGQPLDE